MDALHQMCAEPYLQESRAIIAKQLPRQRLCIFPACFASAWPHELIFITGMWVKIMWDTLGLTILKSMQTLSCSLYFSLIWHYHVAEPPKLEKHHVAESWPGISVLDCSIGKKCGSAKILDCIWAAGNILLPGKSLHYC